MQQNQVTTIKQDQLFPALQSLKINQSISQKQSSLARQQKLNQQKSQIIPISIGCVIFNHKFTAQQQKKYIGPYQRSILQSSAILIEQDQRNKNWNQIFEFIQEITSQYLFLNLTNHKFIILQISHVKFNNLIALDLQNNQIRNIQALNFIQIQKIKQLFLKQNQIANIKPLVKSRWNMIQEIHLTKNRITNINVQQFGRITAKKIHGVTFWFRPQWNRIIFSDVSFLIKSGIHQPSCTRVNISIRSFIDQSNRNGGIQQEKYICTLKQKYFISK